MSTAWDSHSEVQPGWAGDPSSTTAATDVCLTQGQRVDRYVILYPLGRGGMGIVYAAYDPELDRKVAVKLLHAHRAGRQGSTRLIREAKAIARLSHPHVVGVHDVGTYEGRVYVAMEFVDGVTLRGFLQEKRPPWPVLVKMLCDAGSALAAAHAMDLVHRDFKPDNVLIDRTGRAVVLDFGLARRAGGGSASDKEPCDAPPKPAHSYEFSLDLTRTGARIGTPAYMAPEQHLGHSVDARTDQFAFCLVLWEALYGMRPFGRDPEQLAARTVAGRVLDPPRGVKIPAYVREALQRGLSPRPEDRFETMQDLISALRRGPARRRKATWVGFGCIAVFVGAVATELVTRVSASSACGPERRDFGAVWDVQTSRAMQDTFSRMSPSLGATTAQKVEHQIEQSIETWKAAHRDACENADLFQTKTQRARALECLDSRRAEVTLLIAELLRADEIVVEHAIEATSELRSPRTCLEPRPEDDVVASREGVADEQWFFQELRSVQAKERAGRYDDALRLAQHVRAQAELWQHPGLLARAHFALGSVLERKGDYAEAEAAFLRTIWSGSRGRVESVVASAWVRLVWITGVERVQLEQGELWAQFAEAALDRIGRPELLHAMWLHNVGGLRFRQDRLHESLALYERALASQERLLGAAHPVVATTYNHMGNVLIELERYEDAQRACERSLALRRQLLGDRHPLVAAAYNNLAELFRKRGEPHASLEHARSALALVEGSAGPEEATARLVAGEAHEALEQWDEAAAQYARVVALTRRSGRGQAAAGLRGLGRARRAQGDLEAALDHWREAVALDSARAPDWAAQTQCWIAEVEHLRRNPEAARAALADAERLAHRSGVGARIAQVETLRGQLF